jgi:tRNA(Ile)-lysidine synthase
VATVDHGLRPESSVEAAFVGHAAANLGLPHATLAWTGDKPSTGVQAAAREARYDLLARHCVTRGGAACVLLTAHTADDQAETVLMRLARGSGIDGLAGIARDERLLRDATTEDNRSVAIVIRRPLRDISKARLVATAEARSIHWCEDASNVNVAFERVRIRQAMPRLAALGLTTDALVRTARRVAAGREALTAATRAALSNPELVRMDPIGFAVIDARCWTAPHLRVPAAVRERILSALIRRVGGLVRPLSLAAIEDVEAAIAATLTTSADGGFGVTLGQTIVRVHRGEILVVREWGRSPPSPVRLAPGQNVVWDGRFRIGLSVAATGTAEIGPLGSAGRSRLKAEGHIPPGIPTEALETTPALRDRDEIVSVPGLAEHWRLLGSEDAKERASVLAGAGWAELATHSVNGPAADTL